MSQEMQDSSAQIAVVECTKCSKPERHFVGRARIAHLPSGLAPYSILFDLQLFFLVPSRRAKARCEFLRE
jgi:hypothetical protein